MFLEAMMQITLVMDVLGGYDANYIGNWMFWEVMMQITLVMDVFGGYDANYIGNG